MIENKKTKRFIAGAVCPRCAEMDKLVMFDDTDGQQVRECVRCGYSDVMTANGPQVLTDEELETRVNKPRVGEQPLVHEDEIQRINIIDPSTVRRDH